MGLGIGPEEDSGFLDRAVEVLDWEEGEELTIEGEVTETSVTAGDDEDLVLCLILLSNDLLLVLSLLLLMPLSLTLSLFFPLFCLDLLLTERQVERVERLFRFSLAEMREGEGAGVVRRLIKSSAGWVGWVVIMLEADWGVILELT